MTSLDIAKVFLDEAPNLMLDCVGVWIGIMKENEKKEIDRLKHDHNDPLILIALNLKWTNFNWIESTRCRVSFRKWFATTTAIETFPSHVLHGRFVDAINYTISCSKRGFNNQFKLMDSHSSLEMYWKRVFDFRTKPKNPFCELWFYISLSKCKCNLAKMIIVSSIYMWRYILTYVNVLACIQMSSHCFGRIYDQCVSEFFNAFVTSCRATLWGYFRPFCRQYLQQVHARWQQINLFKARQTA